MFPTKSVSEAAQSRLAPSILGFPAMPSRGFPAYSNDSFVSIAGSSTAQQTPFLRHQSSGPSLLHRGASWDDVVISKAAATYPPSTQLQGTMGYSSAGNQSTIPQMPWGNSIWTGSPVSSSPGASFYDRTVDHRDSLYKSKSHNNNTTTEEQSPTRNSDEMNYYSLEKDEHQGSSAYKGKGKAPGQRKPSNRDEFDGPHQLLDRPLVATSTSLEQDLPRLATTLMVDEQDRILSCVNDRLSMCAFDFVAKYQFPIPLEPDKRPVRVPADREWTEWVYLLKRLATKRRIPARVLYNGQIKQFITILENSMEMRHAAKHQSRPIKDDRNVLQLISAGIQVAKIVKDADAMEYLDQLYAQTERMIQSRKSQRYIV